MIRYELVGYSLQRVAVLRFQIYFFINKYLLPTQLNIVKQI